MKPLKVVLFVLLPCALVGLMIGGWLAYYFIIHNGLDGQKTINIPFWITILCCWIMMFNSGLFLIRKKRSKK
jgi:hypothetical protein